MPKKPDGFCSRNAGSYKAILNRRRELHGTTDSLEPRSSKSIFNFSDCLMTGINALWRQKLMCDVLLIVEGKSFPAHKLVLASCSDYFFGRFGDGKDNPGSDQLELQDVKAGAIVLILECMYTGRISLTQNTVKDVLSAATTLGFLGIHEACEEYLTEHLTVENCFVYMDVACTYDLQSLLEKTSQIAAKHFSKASKRNEFRYVPAEQLIALLKRNDLEAKNEYEVFELVLAWIEVDKQRRIEYASELLQNVRLPLMTPSEIIDKVESVGYLMDIPDCEKLVKEALHYHCMPCRQSLLQTSRTEPRLPYRDHCLVAVGGAPRLKTDRISSDIMVLDVDTPDAKWELIACLPEPRHHHAVAVMNGFLYVSGGEITNNHGFPSKSAFRYDPRHDTWLQIASMKQRRESFQMVVLHNMLYAVGGRFDKNTSLACVERYDPSKDEWKLIAPMSTPKQSVAVAALGGKVYAVGGSGGRFDKNTSLACVERYDPSKDEWKLIAPMSTPKQSVAVAALGGKVYAVGGSEAKIISSELRDTVLQVINGKSENQSIRQDFMLI